MDKYNLNIIKNEAFTTLHNEKYRTHIMVDDKTAHYVTIDKYFKTMIYIIEMYLSDKNNFSLLDAFAGIGSDTIGFMTRYIHDSNELFKFKYITAIEKDIDRFRMLSNNIFIYQKDYNIKCNNIKILNGDMLNIINTNHKYDVIYMDPPWGDNYQMHEKMRIHISSLPIEKIVEQLYLTRIAQELIVVKLPKNYDYSYFKTYNVPFIVYEILKTDGSVYMNLLIVPCKKQIKDNVKYFGWNFKKIESHLL